MMKFGKIDSGWDAESVAIAVIYALSVLLAMGFARPGLAASAQSASPKYEPLYLGYAGRKWDHDYGVIEGQCNRQAVGLVLGSSAPARVDKDNSRQVATVVGGMVNAGAGQEVDDKDRACIGHALELAGIERGVAWTNTNNGVAYRVIPLGGFNDQGKSCREFVTRMTISGHDETVRHKACSAGDGVWQIVG